MPPENRFETIRNWVIGVTGVLIVVPALIYAGIDILKAVDDIPLAEKTNEALFKKYFGKSPLHTVPIPIKKDGMIAEVKFSVYEEGDIYIEYGNRSQWFESPLNKSKDVASSFSIINKAYAQDLSHLYGPYQQFDQYRGQLIERTRRYASGAVEVLLINPRSGQIVNQQVTPPPNNYQAPPSQYGGIDLDQQYGRPQQNLAAFYCMTQQGNCQLVQPIPKGANCFCSTPYGPVYGIGQ